jgi:hypothetical protein
MWILGNPDQLSQPKQGYFHTQYFFFFYYYYYLSTFFFACGLLLILLLCFSEGLGISSEPVGYHSFG